MFSGTVKYVHNPFGCVYDFHLLVKSVTQHIEYVLLVVKIYCKVYESELYAAPYYSQF